MCLSGATEEVVTSMEEVQSLLARGSAVRTTSNTLMNEVSTATHPCLSPEAMTTC